MVELIINEDITISKTEHRDKYAKYGFYYPIMGDDCFIIRQGIRLDIACRDQVFIFPGDTLYNTTRSTATLYVIRFTG